MGKKCWNCKAEVLPKDFFCKFCKKIQENVEIDEFEIFTMDKSVFINLDLLEKKHLELQMTFHPNKFINLSNSILAMLILKKTGIIGVIIMRPCFPNS